MPENGQSGCTLPQIDFSSFILSFASSILMHLGEIDNPETGKKEPNFVLAKQSIDTLSMLEKKFRQGLTPEEKGLLESVLCDVKMKFVRAHAGK